MFLGFSVQRYNNLLGCQPQNSVDNKSFDSTQGVGKDQRNLANSFANQSCCTFSPWKIVPDIPPAH